VCVRVCVLCCCWCVADADADADADSDSDFVNIRLLLYTSYVVLLAFMLNIVYFICTFLLHYLDLCAYEKCGSLITMFNDLCYSKWNQVVRQGVILINVKGVREVAAIFMIENK